MFLVRIVELVQAQKLFKIPDEPQIMLRVGMMQEKLGMPAIIVVQVI